MMSENETDALVFFGVTGDLAFKQIFPALQSMIRHDDPHLPIIGVAKSVWTDEQLRQRARESVQKHGGLDAGAFAKLASAPRSARRRGRSSTWRSRRASSRRSSRACRLRVARRMRA